METISVIIPTWNRESVIERAVKSALSQSHPPMEVLVCDDGSDDQTRQIIREYEKLDDRVKWLAGPRGGRPAIPRNRGIQQSKGEWLAFLDSDDEWLPNKLEIQIKMAKELGVKAACSNAKRLLPNRGIVGNVLNGGDSTSFIRFWDLLTTNTVICSSALIHRSVLEVAERFPENVDLRGLEDYALWLRVSTQTDFAYVPRPQLIYYDDPDNSVRRFSPSIWVQRRRVYGNTIWWIMSDKRRRKALKRYRNELVKRYFLEVESQIKTKIFEIIKNSNK